jgi:hypothetical protein
VVRTSVDDTAPDIERAKRLVLNYVGIEASGMHARKADGETLIAVRVAAFQERFVDRVLLGLEGSGRRGEDAPLIGTEDGDVIAVEVAMDIEGECKGRRW